MLRATTARGRTGRLRLKVYCQIYRRRQGKLSHPLVLQITVVQRYGQEIALLVSVREQNKIIKAVRATCAFIDGVPFVDAVAESPNVEKLLSNSHMLSHTQSALSPTSVRMPVRLMCQTH
jgi:hypothetical protein